MKPVAWHVIAGAFPVPDAKGRKTPLSTDQTVLAHTADAATIRRVAGQCLKRVPLDKKLRLLGVRVGALVKHDEAAIHEQKMPLAQKGRAQAAIESIAATGQLF